MPPPYRIEFTRTAQAQKDEIERTDEKKHKKVLKTLGFLSTNPRHPGLHTHDYETLEGPWGEKVFQSYVENRNPAAYRLFWCWKKGIADTIIVTGITPHP